MKDPTARKLLDELARLSGYTPVWEYGKLTGGPGALDKLGKLQMQVERLQRQMCCLLTYLQVEEHQPDCTPVFRKRKGAK